MDLISLDQSGKLQNSKTLLTLEVISHCPMFLCFQTPSICFVFKSQEPLCAPLLEQGKLLYRGGGWVTLYVWIIPPQCVSRFIPNQDPPSFPPSPLPPHRPTIPETLFSCIKLVPRLVKHAGYRNEVVFRGTSMKMYQKRCPVPAGYF